MSSNMISNIWKLDQNINIIHAIAHSCQSLLWLVIDSSAMSYHLYPYQIRSVCTVIWLQPLPKLLYFEVIYDTGFLVAFSDAFFKSVERCCSQVQIAPGGPFSAFVWKRMKDIKRTGDNKGRQEFAEKRVQNRLQMRYRENDKWIVNVKNVKCLLNVNLWFILELILFKKGNLLLCAFLWKIICDVKYVLLCELVSWSKLNYYYTRKGGVRIQ